MLIQKQKRVNSKLNTEMDCESATSDDDDSLLGKIKSKIEGAPLSKETHGTYFQQPTEQYIHHLPP